MDAGARRVAGYGVSLALHVAAAVVGFGATFTYPVLQLVGERGDRRHLGFALGAILAISRFVAIPAALVVVRRGRARSHRAAGLDRAASAFHPTLRALVHAG